MLSHLNMFISTWALTHELLLAIIANLGSGVVVEACETGWFGTNCQYKCHCTSDNCDSRGECAPGNVCVSGWFGPACQYQDLLTIPGTLMTPTGDLITDRVDDTCLTSDVNNLTITFNTTYPMTWIRFTVQLPDLLNSITLMSADHPEVAQRCNRTSRGDNKTMDIFCDNDVIVHELVVYGRGIKSLCSLYISGGRNVALRQRATQSSTYSDGGHPESMSRANNAVDGNTSGDFSDSSCSHTMVNDTAPNWNVTFSTSQLVNRYVLYNRNTFMERMTGVHISSFNANGVTVFSYTVPDTSQAVYTVIWPTQPVTFIKILKSAGNIILTLCEVEIYGDSLCPFNTYGLECNSSCNCENKTETCHVATGGCPSGCAAGFYGEGCHFSCKAQRWGVDCLNHCSGNCVNQSCYPTNGVCVYGCAAGYKGVDCIDECLSEKWGAGCMENCSSNCKSKTCDKINGKCNFGCEAGYTGDNCSEVCSLNKWGPNCNQSCSEHCVDQTCNRFNGACVSGHDDGVTSVNGTQGCSCDDKLGLGLGIGIAASCVIGLVIACIISCIFKRRHQDPRQDVSDNNYVNRGPQSLPINMYETLKVYATTVHDKPKEFNATKGTSSSDSTEIEQNHYYEIMGGEYVNPGT